MEWLSGDGTCWGSAAGLYDVTGQSNEDVRTLVGSPRGEALMERRRQNLVVNREPSFFPPWIGEQLDDEDVS